MCVCVCVCVCVRVNELNCLFVVHKKNVYACKKNTIIQMFVYHVRHLLCIVVQCAVLSSIWCTGGAG